MSNKVKDIDIKNRIYYLFHDIINTKNFDLNNIKKQKYFYLLYCICDDQRFKIRKNYWCKFFKPHFPQSE